MQKIEESIMLALMNYLYEYAGSDSGGRWSI